MYHSVHLFYSFSEGLIQSSVSHFSEMYRPRGKILVDPELPVDVGNFPVRQLIALVIVKRMNLQHVLSKP